MSETVRGIYRNGVIEPLQPLKIAEGTEVYVTVARKRTREEILAQFEKLKEYGLEIHYDADNIGKPFPEARLGQIQGKPLSETIIEERRGLE